MPSVRDTFNKSANRYNRHALVQSEIAERTEQKLDYITPNTGTILDLGSGTGLMTEKIVSRFPESRIICLDFAQKSLIKNNSSLKICADANKIPLADNSIDIVVSNLMMQWCTDLDNVFKECYRVLNSDGLFLFSTFGPDTLKELKKSWSVVDDKVHVNTFTDMHDIGDILLDNYFQSPVMEMDTLKIQYQTVIDLLRDLKGIGAQTVVERSKSLTGKDKFNAMIKMYETYRMENKIPATYEVIYGHAWKKSNSLGAIEVNNMNTK
ncbi:MAG: malonyl-ACP O-methyltransferase BioC [PS1 clade bacterium]